MSNALCKNVYREEEDIDDSTEEEYTIYRHSIFLIKDKGWYVGKSTHTPSYSKDIPDDWRFDELNKEPLDLKEALNLLCGDIFKDNMEWANEVFAIQMNVK